MERSIKELLIILRDSLAEGDKEGWINNGICGEILNLYAFDVITAREDNILFSYICNNKPKNTEQFIGYWWPVMFNNLVYRHVRIDFINKLIDEIE